MIHQFLNRLAQNANPENLVASSIKDYHVKGFDYICLHRSPDLTVKLYFFDGDINQMSEVVNPHDHRYDFDTHVITGSFTDFSFVEDDDGEVFQKFKYRTPLLGGNGFTWNDEVKLKKVSEVTTKKGGSLTHDAEDFHTIRINEKDTVLCLLQYSDKPNLESTWTFTNEKQAPDLNGLYTKFTTDQIMTRLTSIGLAGA